MNKENKRNRKLYVWLSDQEMTTIKSYFQQTILPNLSEYVREILLKKPVIGRYRDTGTEELLKELTVMRRDFHDLIITYNQQTKKLNTASESEINSSQEQVHQLEQIIQESARKLSRFLDQTAEKWLLS
ncbi:hypothetical protein [Algoriphagus sp. PAP.12]|uniref:plasmid mobilization protein n=1 Tax=Algoriphagus sp. PAP.12 TaxID=2996678 RepID=UPI002DD42AC1|nr:hypothetical protein [Algoriphagus sp. PAP.12]